MMILRVGSAAAGDVILLPEVVLQRLHLRRGEQVILTAAPGGFRIIKYTRAIARQIKLAEEIVASDANILRELSDK